MIEDDDSMGEIGGLLADIRDMFPVPERGTELEVAWAGAMASPECVGFYVKDCLAAMTDERTNILRASLDSSDLAGQALETVAEQAVEIASLKEKNRALTLELLKVLAHIMHDVCNKFAAVLPEPEKQPAPNDKWCVGCSPENCSGCGT